VLLQRTDSGAPASPWLPVVAMRGLPWLGSLVTLVVCGPLLLPGSGPDYVAVGATLTATVLAVAAACALTSVAVLVDTVRLAAALPRGVLCACRCRRPAASSGGTGTAARGGGGGIMADFVDARTMQRDAALPVLAHGLLLGGGLAGLAGCVVWLLLRALVVVAAAAAANGAPYLPLPPYPLSDGGDATDLARPPVPYPSWAAYVTPPWAAAVLVCALTVTAVADGTVPRLRRAAAVFRLRWQLTSLLALLGPIPTALVRVDDTSTVRYRHLSDDEAALLAAATAAQQAVVTRAAGGWRQNPLGTQGSPPAHPTLTPLKLAAADSSCGDRGNGSGSSSDGSAGERPPPSPPSAVSQQCSICVSAPADAAFASCGHACCCGCADRLVRKGLFKLAVQLQQDAAAGGGRGGPAGVHAGGRRSRSRARAVGRLVSSQPPPQPERPQEAGAAASRGPLSRDSRDSAAAVTGALQPTAAARIRVGPDPSAAAAAAALHDRRARAARALQPPRSASVPVALGGGSARIASAVRSPPLVRAVIRVDDSGTEGGAFGSLGNPMFRHSGSRTMTGGGDGGVSRAVTSTASAPCSPTAAAAGAGGGGPVSRTSRTALLEDDGDEYGYAAAAPSTSAARRALGDGGRAGGGAEAGGSTRIGATPALTSVRVAAFGSLRTSRTTTDGLYAAALGVPAPAAQETAAPQLPGAAAAASSSADDPSHDAAAGTGIGDRRTAPAAAPSAHRNDATQQGGRSSFAVLAATALPPAVLRRWPKCPFCREPVSHVVKVGQLSVLQEGGSGGTDGSGNGGKCSGGGVSSASGGDPTGCAAPRRLVVAEVTPL
jgi:hypothetical protein